MISVHWSSQQEFAWDASPQYMQNLERLVFLFQRIYNFLCGAFGQFAVFEELNDFTNEYLIIFGKLRTSADLLCPYALQKGRGIAVATMYEVGLLGFGIGGL